MKLHRTALLLAAIALPAAAHTPFLAPTHFDAREGATVSLDAAFAEAFFVPEVVFDNSDFVVTDPAGVTRAAETVQRLRTRAVVEHRLDAGKGTYRFSTGARLGALFRTWEQGGKRESTRDPAVKIPAGAKVISDFQSLTLAETYITAGAPDRAALAARGKGLEFVALTHPSDLYVGEHFDFVVQYDGAPLPRQKVEVTEAVWTSDRTAEVTTLESDAEGRIRLPLARAGTFLALARHRSPAPAGAPVPEYSNSYTLTFHVLTP
ncbi:DUF4198 domain-containing protein [Stenotrophomonas mori]|uniref:DUF4198 domain-containing protein n=1 Tax=Stenotrophomonas mori TaxID=2871096 RepID=A0ABT0SHU6_9GAMM|nr:DUF4198 domain-containing protein [Stenotrophomonas mori]MCL7714894.1 DUF4198 domain-containing protein [Stenotrophomonas mori]